jgi:hypothetical protein
VLDVLEQLNSTPPRVTTSSPSGRRVHIDKLHITVQRPVAEPPAQPAQVPEPRTVSFPKQVFFDPWEKHYSSFD